MKTKSIYRILKTLIKYAGREDFDAALISAEQLGMSYAEWQYLLVLLQKSGLVDGVLYSQTLSQRYPQIESISGIGITLSGIEYVEENSAMKKVEEALRMAGEII